MKFTQFFIKPFLALNDLPEMAILIPEKFNVIKAVTYFNYAEKLGVYEEQFLAYSVALENKKYLLIESGRDPLNLPSRIKELYEKNVRQFLFVNKGYSLNKKKSHGQIFLIKKSKLDTCKQAINIESGLMKKIQGCVDIQTGSSLSIDILGLFFNKDLESKKQTGVKFDVITVGDYYFFKFLKLNKLSGAAIDYIAGDGSRENPEKENEYFDNTMNLILEFLKTGLI